MKKKEISIKKTISPGEAAMMLKDIVVGLEKGEFTLREENDSLTFKPRDMLSLEIKAKAKKEKEKIEIELSWKCPAAEHECNEHKNEAQEQTEHSAADAV